MSIENQQDYENSCARFYELQAKLDASKSEFEKTKPGIIGQLVDALLDKIFK